MRFWTLLVAVWGLLALPAQAQFVEGPTQSVVDQTILTQYTYDFSTLLPDVSPAFDGDACLSYFVSFDGQGGSQMTIYQGSA